MISNDNQQGLQKKLIPDDSIIIDKNNISVSNNAKVRGMKKEEFDNLTDEQKKGAIVVTDEEASGSGTFEEIYSTEEQRIGTWIDGKPLYKMVILDVLLPSEPNTTITHAEYGLTALQIDTLVDYTAMQKTSAGNFAKLPFCNATASGTAVTAWTMFEMSMSKAGISFTTYGTSSGSSWFGRPMTVTLKYTKTTD